MEGQNRFPYVAPSEIGTLPKTSAATKWLDRTRFRELLRWGKEPGAKPRTEHFATEPAFAKNIVDILEKRGVTRDIIGQWTRFYDETFKLRGPNAPEQFRYRSEGLQRLYDQFPGDESTAPASPGPAPSAPASPCPSWLCGGADEEA